MILVERGTEPQALTDARAKLLPKLRQIVAGGNEPESKDIFGYGPKEVRDALWKAQHGKCCYCEKEIENRREDVEHYRPKAEANRHPGSLLTHGYWWLAFTWSNLLYACPQCNQPPAKGVQFPLEIGCSPLTAELPAPGNERPLLIDPAEESGVKHIVFKRQRRGNRDVWVPEERDNSPKGYWTIKVCQLDRDALIKRYTDHVRDHVIPVKDKVRDALDSNDARRIHADVYRAHRKLLVKYQRFVGLSFDALNYFIPSKELAPWNLSWQMPT
jgi:uncharacterized protein (TIGR02646 family)